MKPICNVSDIFKEIFLNLKKLLNKNATNPRTVIKNINMYALT